MAIGVSKWSGKVGITSLTSGSPTPIPLPTSNYLHLPLHEAGSTTGFTVNRGNVGPSECKVGGTLTSTWSVPGEITLGTDNYVNFGSTAGALQSLFNLDNLIGIGGLLLLFRIKVPDITTNRPVLSCSPSSVADGGWEILVVTSEVLRIGTRGVGAGSLSYQTMQTLTIGAYANCLVYVDMVNDTVHWSLNGAATSSAAIPGATPRPKVNSASYMRFGGLSEAADPPSGGFGAPAMALSDRWVLRSLSDISGNLDSIAEDYHASYYEPRLRSLSNL